MRYQIVWACFQKQAEGLRMKSKLTGPQNNKLEVGVPKQRAKSADDVKNKLEVGVPKRAKSADDLEKFLRKLAEEKIAEAGSDVCKLRKLLVIEIRDTIENHVRVRQGFGGGIFGFGGGLQAFRDSFNKAATGVENNKGSITKLRQFLRLWEDKHNEWKRGKVDSALKENPNGREKAKQRYREKLMKEDPFPKRLQTMLDALGSTHDKQ